VDADTIVVAGKHILGKPADSDQAREFLRILSGKRHRVITGLTLFNGETGKTLTGEEETAVTFNKLSDEEINQYIATGEPFDKAGAYGIQGYAAQFVRKISGCYFNVVGFPIALFYGMLKEDVNV
jgi:septum formation protein